MFYYIKGGLTVSTPSLAVVEAAGVGYSMTISETTYRSLPRPALTAPPEVLLYTYLSVRENDIELFGFRDERELSSFRMLLSVSGVGPRAALSILSIMTPEKFALAVCAEDRKAISKAPGIGAKSAERIILDLKDKITLEPDRIDQNDTIATSADLVNSDARNEAIEAMTALGYSPSEALKAVKQITVTDDMDAGAILKAALKVIR